jgi:hypothetical protein
VEHEIDLAIEIARLDERIKAGDRLREASEYHSAEALRIAREELARRLDLLNGEHERFAQITAQMVHRDVFSLLVDRVTRMELDAKEQSGKLWFPMLFAAAVAAGMGAAVARIF